MSQTPSSAGPSIPAVVMRTIRELPARTKRGFKLVLVAWTGVLALQVWDSVSEPGARGIVEFGSVALGTAGALLLALNEVLRRVEDSAANQPAVRQIMMALPPIAAASAALLAAAIVLHIARMWFGTNALRMSSSIAVYGVAFALAIVSAANTARRLFAFGQQEAERASRIEAELAVARLATLQAQMNPHFLFNALNTVAALVPADPRAAEATIENLSHVLRMTLNRSEAGAGTLADEVEFVRAYVAVEQQRFGDRLHVEWRIDPAAASATLPPLAIQPLVENAIKHGIGQRREGGRLVIEGTRHDDRLRVIVSDDGEGFPDRHVEGTGLGNLRRRLESLHGSDATLTVASNRQGSQVILDLPFRQIPQTRPGENHARTDR